MFFRIQSHVRQYLIFLVTVKLLKDYTCGIQVKENIYFINHRNLDHCRRKIGVKTRINNQDANPNKYIDNYLNSSDKRNLFKNQISGYPERTSEPSSQNKAESWSDIVYEEILRNKSLLRQKTDYPGESHYYPDDETDLEVKKDPYNFRLSPEGRLKLEDRIEYLKRTAHSSPVKYKEKTPILWIVRSLHGNYCKLLEKDEGRIKSLVERVRKYFSPSELQILVMKLDIKMPLCEIMFEGTMPDLVRIFYARGGTLQFYITPRFWTRCDLIEKDPRLEAKYGKATSPGLFPQWDEDGMVEEIMDCMDTRPDYALEFRVPNAWHILPMMPEYDRYLMQTYFEYVHWPTRLRVQRAFERGIEDYRIIIEAEYEYLKRCSRMDTGISNVWMATPNSFD